MPKSDQQRRKTEAQKRWRAKNPSATKKYNPRAAEKYFQRYHTDWKFRTNELERQREYYEQNREQILARSRARNAKKRG